VHKGIACLDPIEVSLHAGSAFLEVWSTNGFCWHGKGHSEALVEQHRFFVVRHIWVHDCTVAVSLNVSLQTLQGLAPSHLGYLRTFQAPLGEALEDVEEAIGLGSVNKIYERIANQGIAGKVKGGIEEVVGTCEVMRIDERQQVIATVIVRDIPPHHCCVRGCSGVVPRKSWAVGNNVVWTLMRHGHDHDWICLLHHRHDHYRDIVLTIWHLHLCHATVIWCLLQKLDRLLRNHLHFFLLLPAVVLRRWFPRCIFERTCLPAWTREHVCLDLICSTYKGGRAVATESCCWGACHGP